MKHQSMISILFFLLFINLSASPLYDFTGPGGSSQPFSGRSEKSISASYFNPALLPETTTGFQFSYMFLLNGISTSYAAKSPTFNISSAIYNARKLNSDGSSSLLEGLKPLPTDELPAQRGSRLFADNSQYLSVGYAAHFLKKKLGAGLTLTFPLSALQAQRPFFVDEREQYFSNSIHFELYGDRLSSQTISAGVGFNAHPRFSIGAGITLALNSVAKSRVFTSDPSDQDDMIMLADVEAKLSYAPHVAISVKLLKSVQINLTAHAPYSNTVHADSSLSFFKSESEDDNSIKKNFAFAYFYTPWRFATSFSFSPENAFFSINGTVIYALWSHYKNRVNEPAENWKDTVSCTLGSTMTFGANNLGIDFIFVPTPVPTQDGQTNYVDNHRIGASVSYQYHFETESYSINFGPAVQFHYLFHRSHTKQEESIKDEFPDSIDVKNNEIIEDSKGLQTNNPGFPGFSHGGFFLISSLSLEILL